MVDMMPMPEGQPVPTDQPAAEGRPKGFLASPQTKLIVIVAAVVALLVIVGLVVVLVLLNLGKNVVEKAAVDTLNASLNATVTPAVSATGSVESTTQGERIVIPVTNKDVFTSRDPFVPVLKPLPAIVASSTETTPSARDRGVLVLENIVTSGGVLKAIFKWEGTLHTNVLAGQVIKDSPWQVLSLTRTTATMLYGDVQVTLSIGEGVAKD